MTISVSRIWNILCTLYNVQDYIALFLIALFAGWSEERSVISRGFSTMVYMWGFGNVFTCWKHLNDSIISLRGEVWAHKTSLTPPHLIEVLVPGQESERSCICVFREGANRFCLFLRFFYWILELFRQCGMPCFILLQVWDFFHLTWFENLLLRVKVFHSLTSLICVVFLLCHGNQREKIP